MSVAPGDTPVTTPVLSTVATNGSDDVHGAATSGVPEPVSAVVNP